MRAHLKQDHRYEHIVRVARLADRLAQRHGANASNARAAGLLHDLARLYSSELLLAECEARGLPIGEFERRNPIVLHAPLGAELAREMFGVDDPDVLSAIRYHTTAAPVMSRLDAILYLADGLEPGRSFPEREALERLAFTDLDAAMCALLRSTITYLTGRGLEPAPQMLAALASHESLERRALPA